MPVASAYFQPYHYDPDLFCQDFHSSPEQWTEYGDDEDSDTDGTPMMVQIRKKNVSDHKSCRGLKSLQHMNCLLWGSSAVSDDSDGQFQTLDDVDQAISPPYHHQTVPRLHHQEDTLQMVQRPRFQENISQILRRPYHRVDQISQRPYHQEGVDEIILRRYRQENVHRKAKRPYHRECADQMAHRSCVEDGFHQRPYHQEHTFFPRSHKPRRQRPQTESNVKQFHQQLKDVMNQRTAGLNRQQRQTTPDGLQLPNDAEQRDSFGVEGNKQKHFHRNKNESQTFKEVANPSQRLRSLMNKSCTPDAKDTSNGPLQGMDLFSTVFASRHPFRRNNNNSNNDVCQDMPLLTRVAWNHNCSNWKPYEGPPGYSSGECCSAPLNSQEIDILLNVTLSGTSGNLIKESEVALLASDANNILVNYLISVKYNLTYVMDRLLDRIRRNFLFIAQTKQFLCLSMDYVVIFLEDSDIDVPDELDIFCIALSWIDYNKQERVPLAGRILRCVRFVHIHPADIVEYVEPNIHLFTGEDGTQAIINMYRPTALIAANMISPDNEEEIPPRRMLDPGNIYANEPPSVFAQPPGPMPMSAALPAGDRSAAPQLSANLQGQRSNGQWKESRSFAQAPVQTGAPPRGAARPEGSSRSNSTKTPKGIPSEDTPSSQRKSAGSSARSAEEEAAGKSADQKKAKDKKAGKKKSKDKASKKKPEEDKSTAQGEDTDTSVTEGETAGKPEDKKKDKQKKAGKKKPKDKPTDQGEAAGKAADEKEAVDKPGDEKKGKRKKADKKKSGDESADQGEAADTSVTEGETAGKPEDKKKDKKKKAGKKKPKDKSADQTEPADKSAEEG